VYVELLRLEKYIKVSERIAERRKQNAELIKLRYEGGREHLGSAMRSRAIADEAAFEVRQTSRRIESQSILLGQEIGGEFKIPMTVEGDLVKMTPELSKTPPDYAKLSEATPHVMKLIKEAESLKASILSAQSVVWPQVNGTLDYNYSADRLTRMRDSFNFGFNVVLPLFNGGKNVEGILKAKADFDAAWQAAKSAQDAAIAELSDAWVQFQDAVENVQVRRNFLNAALKRSEIVRSEYTTGLVNFQDFDIAEQDLTDSEKAYVQSLADVLTKEANWEFVKGSTLEDAVHANQ
jgi:outer membrane protein TolC